ncbi:MAG: hypothetical protein ACOYNS_07995 [Bacteroidota bacterium]
MKSITMLMALSVITVAVVIIGCESGGDVNRYSQPTPVVPDTSITITSFPTNVELQLGKSIRIQNAGTVFEFYSVVSDTRSMVNNEVVGNAKILLYVDYGPYQKYVELNSSDVPVQYTLENGLHFVIQLKEVIHQGSSYQIIFEFNEYWNW